ncbi:hypothetical protein NM208_g5973 [Fusarium decemcellulare]|uniref:Uncharacterized protein n=1 Tax=Fusarium decemcellulare TaxID=57161 RepID=A0ACC1SEU2_9HYPO|nr:hypothetical protein NM208_g5973 [Fusarium decemcellulare]
MRQRSLQEFLGKLEELLGTETTPFNISAAWNSSRPDLAPASLPTLLNTTYSTLISQRQGKLVRDPFFADYARKHDGRRPFVNPAPLVRWAYGDGLPEDAYVEGLKNKTIFKDWFENNVLGPGVEACSDGILAYVSPAATQYRNTYRSQPTVPVGFPTTYWSVFAETPDITLPIGQTSYNSTVTNHAEELPVTINLLVAKGCDSLLLEFVAELVNRGVLKTSAVGANAVDGGEILLK